MGGGDLITFKIKTVHSIGVEYNAERGMTWEQWINSEYNTDNYYIFNGKVYQESYIHDITASDIIFDNGVYIMEERHAGGGAN